MPESADTVLSTEPCHPERTVMAGTCTSTGRCHPGGGCAATARGCIVGATLGVGGECELFANTRWVGGGKVSVACDAMAPTLRASPATSTDAVGYAVVGWRRARA